MNTNLHFLKNSFLSWHCINSKLLSKIQLGRSNILLFVLANTNVYQYVFFLFLGVCPRTFSNVEILPSCSVTEESVCNWKCINKYDQKPTNLHLTCGIDGEWHLNGSKNIKCLTIQNGTSSPPEFTFLSTPRAEVYNPLRKWKLSRYLADKDITSLVGLN